MDYKPPQFLNILRASSKWNVYLLLYNLFLFCVLVPMICFITFVPYSMFLMLSFIIISFFFHFPCVIWWRELALGFQYGEYKAKLFNHFVFKLLVWFGLN